MSEKPVHSRRRKLVDWINLTDAKKVHSLIDKVYKRKNLEMAWEKVKERRSSPESVSAWGCNSPGRLDGWLPVDRQLSLAHNMSGVFSK